MFFVVLMLLSALSVSAIAAYYSIIGLIAIFAASPAPIAIMGASLEVAKLITASWLYKNWDNAPRAMKYYFTVAVVILVFITSVGIFGFLSKAHLEANINVGETSVQLKILKERESMLNERLQYLYKKAGDDPEKIARATNRAILETQDSLQKIKVEQLPLLREENKQMAEVGPLKYIAELIYGDDVESHFDSAVRFVIILLVFVFDPLAVLLVVASNYSLKQLRGELPKPTKVPTKVTTKKQTRKKAVKKKIGASTPWPVPVDKNELKELRDKIS